ncbi:hypothetical protein YM3MPS_52850 [Mycobacterium pseudoshottsii]|uniref:Uncharacterized protein n=1 Tax=Mycobacterium pseudoshottsii TaxID=265949 RepID=A0A9N7LSG6_9MYCO|nr:MULTISPECIES: hypothetical protein [Mycobacterium]MBC9862995.1 hypothetical protein [Mycobacterium pseudoshottsii]RFZ64846.1 hypothetical protein DL240490_02446 [Mycobacterium marinum]BBA90614.1 hypothetical protein MPSD_53730 [Mycobacterium pseudoshottsii JCM 15466]BDN85110.1 hypothetical protein NJB1907Z4_C53250 [Mycobacterium pseudoshottsii]BEH79482.1 hypothetical protein YM3MPS_52850 [Mycobacterium pseudoshottsii]
MVAVASSAVDGGEMPAIVSRTGLDLLPGHWWPAPATEINVTLRASVQEAVWVVTTPEVVEVGGAHASMAR